MGTMKLPRDLYLCEDIIRDLIRLKFILKQFRLRAHRSKQHVHHNLFGIALQLL